MFLTALWHGFTDSFQHILKPKITIMKKMISKQAKILFNRTALLMATFALSCYSFAQDKKIDVNINTKPESDNGSSFFMQPWVWIVGGAVFILLLIALLRNNKK
jgi:cell division protein FtsW (lipid II flippase)